MRRYPGPEATQDGGEPLVACVGHANREWLGHEWSSQKNTSGERSAPSSALGEDGLDGGALPRRDGDGTDGHSSVRPAARKPVLG